MRLQERLQESGIDVLADSTKVVATGYGRVAVDFADYVITDSVHCTAFSLNFNKEFFTFYPGKYSARLHSILTLTGTENRAEPKNADDLKEIDYTSVNEVLNKERNRATAFIKKYCERN